MQLKLLLLKMFRALGLLDRWRNARRHDVVFVMIHGTADPRSSAEWLPLRAQQDPRDFDRLLEKLSRYYRFVGFDEAVDILAGRRPPVEYPLVLTFDDGYRSNVRDALPVLRKYGAPMTVFLTVSHVDKQIPMWVDRLDFALQQVPVNGRRFVAGTAEVTFRAKTRKELQESFHRLRKIFKREYRSERSFHDAIRTTCEKLEREGGRSLNDLFADDPWSGILTWDEVREAARDGVTFGSHAVDHYRLGYLEKEEALRQLRESREAITAMTGSCRYLAYPDGSYCAETMRLSRECGYDAALTTQEGRNIPGACDLMALHRTSVNHTWGETELLCRVSGLSAAVSVDGVLRFLGIQRRGEDRGEQ